MVCVLAFYSDDPSSNPAEVYSFYSVDCLKRTKNNQKEAGDGPFFKKTVLGQLTKICWQLIAPPLTSDFTGKVKFT